ncbi:MAG: FapA family protein [Desulfatiglandales bacterium]
MTDTRHQIVECPSCLFRYRVPEAFQGRSLSCKKCGRVFKLVFTATQPQDDAAPPSTETAGDAQKISTDDHSILIGNLAIRYKLATKEQIKKAIGLQEQKKSEGQHLPLGKVLVLQGVIDQNQLRFLVSLQSLSKARQSDRVFGAVAVKNKLATRDDIEEALCEQNKIFKEEKAVIPIGEILVRNKILTPQQRDAILSRQERLQTAASKDGEDEAEGQPAEGTDKMEIGFDLRISEDKLTATLVPKGEESSSVTPHDLKAFLASMGIVFGIVDDALIQDYLKITPEDRMPFKIAEGTPPESPERQEIKYYFDTDPLHIGKLGEEDQIDFKDRGPVPQVKEGDLLAEKVPIPAECAGRDVFNEAIPARAKSRAVLRCGKGAVLSDDGTKVFATLQGRPELSAAGKLSVFPELKVLGDVDLKTGHIDFDGDVLVSGTVQSGFRVNAWSLTAGEILQSQIETKGNVLVHGGIMGADIRAGGGVKARHIREARVKALGDVVVEREILDTKVETSGAVITKSGSILSSQIVANGGIQAHQIGSEKSKPCALTVGINARTGNEIKALKEIIASKQAEADDLQQRLKALGANAKTLHQDLATKAQDQDRAIVQQRKLQEKRQELDAGGGKDRAAEIKTALESLALEIAKREKGLEEIFNQQDQIEKEMALLQEKAALHNSEIEAFEQEISDLTARSRSERGTAEIKVSGAVFPYTTIKGPNASLILPEKHENVVIKEVMTRDPNDKGTYKFRLSRT